MGDEQTFAIIGAAMEVHRELGPGFLEAVYGDALELEFASRSIPFAREVPIPVLYKGQRLGTPYRADFVCFERVIVEIKAVKQLTNIEEAQIAHYLKAMKMEVGLLINFAALSLDFKRFIQSPC